MSEKICRIKTKHHNYELKQSQIGELISFDRVMDPYTLRCIPQG